MNVLFIFGQDLTIGGHFKSGIGFGEKLIQSGNSVFAIVKGGTEDLTTPFKEVGIKILSHDFRGSDKYRPVRNISNFFHKVKFFNQVVRNNNIDVIHSHDSIDVVAAYYSSCVNNTGFVYSHAGGVFNDYFPPKKSEFFVFSDELLKEYKTKRRYRKRNIFVISERINPSIYKPHLIDSSFIKKFRLEENWFNVFMGIRLHEQKKVWLDSLIDLLKTVKNSKKNVINVVIAGTGNQRKELEKKLLELNRVTENKIKFQFVGGIESELEMASFYNFSDLVVGHGRGIMEAMGCEKPIVVLGKNGRFEFVSPENISNISFYNFSGRHLDAYIDSKTENAKEFLAKFDSDDFLGFLAKFSRDYFATSLSSVIGTKKLKELYESSMKRNNSLLDVIVWYFHKTVKKRILSKWER